VEKSVLSIEGSYTETPISFGKRIFMSIQLPPNFDIELDSDGGTIQLTNLTGNFKGISLGGDINIARLEGKIDFQTNGGNISVNGGNLEGIVRTLGGHIQISEVAGKWQGISNGGRLIYRNVYKKKYDGEVQLSTLGGDIEIDEAPYGASVNTNGGNIIISMANDNVRAVTKGGNIILRNIRGNIDAQTYSGNIEAELLPLLDEKKYQRCNLVSKSGDVVLHVPESFEAYIDIKLAYTKNTTKQFKIDSDFDLDIEETPEWDFSDGTAKKYIYGKGKIGSGRHSIQIRTVNGDIHLKKGGEIRTKSISYARNCLSYEEIQKSNTTNEYDLIRKLRQHWLYRRGRKTIQHGVANYPMVYMNNLKYGNINSLWEISVESIKEIRFLNSGDATIRFGTDHIGGAILITTL
jgi:DUF4097 and DUF4098 domain-containing protein YvlB